MINFRFHLLSLVAVFLALALGIVMGSTVVDRAIVESLRTQIGDVRERARSARAENDALRRELGRRDAFVRAVAPFAVSGRLPETAVALVVVRGVDEEPLDNLADLVARAGGTVTAVVRLEEPWALGAARREQAAALARLLGVPRRSDRALREAAARALFGRLRDGPGPDPDLLAGLERLGFVSTAPPPGAEGPAGEAVAVPAARVVLAGRSDALPGLRRLPVVLAEAAVAAELPAVLAEEAAVDDPDAPRGNWVAPVRADAGLARQVATVDHLDLTEGRVAAVLALAELAGGVVGAYGYGPGATAPLPAWWAP